MAEEVVDALWRAVLLEVRRTTIRITPLDSWVGATAAATTWWASRRSMCPRRTSSSLAWVSTTPRTPLRKSAVPTRASRRASYSSTLR